MSLKQEMQCAPPPVAITEIMHSSRAAEVLNTAIDLGIFSALDPGPSSAEELAGKLKLSPRGTELLADALVGLGLLQKSSQGYSLTQISDLYLKPSSDLFMGAYISQRAQHNQAWAKLSEVIRTGKPVSQVNQQSDAEAFFPALAASIFPMSYSTAQIVARKLGAESFEASARVLDIAAGSGVWSIPFAEANHKIAVDALDFPVVLETTREFTRRYKVEKQYRFLSGDWKSVQLEKDAYDVVLLGHILHSEGYERSAELIKASFAALKKGGHLVIAEIMPNQERTAPVFPLMFALNMFILTSQGCVFSDSELEKLCRDAGFSEFSRPELPFVGQESPIAIGKK